MKLILLYLLTYSFLNADILIEEAWAKVQARNNALKASQAHIQATQQKQASVSSMYLPSITAVGNYTHLDESVSVELGLPLPLPPLELANQDFFTANLNVLWPLYTGGKIDATQDIYASQVSEAKAKHEMQEDKEFLKLIKYYYGLVLSESLYKTRLEVQHSLLRHVTDAQALKEQGQIAKIELLNAQVKYDAAKIETSQASHKLSLLKSSLKSLIDSNDLPLSKLFVQSDHNTQGYYIQETLNEYSGLKVLQHKEDQVDSLVKIEEADYLPTVAAYGDYALYKDDSILFETLPTWFVGVVVKIDLLSREGRSEKAQEKRLLKSRLHFLQAQAREDLALLVEKTYKEMLQAYSEYHSLNSSVTLAKENVKLRNIAFKEGLTTSVEVVQAQSYLAGSKTKQLNVAYKYVNALAQLFVLSGHKEGFFEFEKHTNGLGNDDE